MALITFWWEINRTKISWLASPPGYAWSLLDSRIISCLPKWISNLLTKYVLKFVHNQIFVSCQHSGPQAAGVDSDAGHSLLEVLRHNEGQERSVCMHKADAADGLQM